MVLSHHEVVSVLWLSGNAFSGQDPLNSFITVLKALPNGSSLTYPLLPDPWNLVMLDHSLPLTHCFMFRVHLLILFKIQFMIQGMWKKVWDSALLPPWWCWCCWFGKDEGIFVFVHTPQPGRFLLCGNSIHGMTFLVILTPLGKEPSSC